MSVIMAKLSEFERDEALGWAHDCFTDMPESIEDWQLIKLVDRMYDGGFYSFRLATGDMPLTVRERLVLEYGDDWASAIDHVARLENNYRTDHEDVILFGLAKANSVYGYDEALEVANYRVLDREWGHLEGFSTGPYNDIDVITLSVDKPAPDDLVEVIRGLSDYPLVSDEEHSFVEMEFIDQHWDDYGKRDTLEAVADAIGAEIWWDLSEAVEQIVTHVTFGGIASEWPYLIDSSAAEFHTEAVAEWVKARVGTVVTIGGWNGTRGVTFDLRKHNLITA